MIRRGHIRHARILALRTVEVLLNEGGPIEVARRARRWARLTAGVRRSNVSGRSSEIQRRYELWRIRNDPGKAELAEQRRLAARFEVRPLVSVAVPVFDPPLAVLREMAESVLRQTYGHLELCVANAGADPACARLLDELAASDPRVKAHHLAENGGVSANSNAALGLGRGDFVALVDHDDVLAPQALFAIVEAINEDPEVDILYSDEDRLAKDGNRVLPFLKPHWSPEFLHSYMWTGHLSVYRRSLVEKLGGFRSEFDGSQDYDLMLRAAAVTDRIRHVPQVLYHWRMIEGSAAAGGKAHARRTNLAALAAAMSATGRKARIVEYPFANRVVFDLVERPLVSIIVPTDDLARARSCVKAIAANTSHEHYEILVVTRSALADLLEREFRPEQARFVRFDEPFNFSAKCNAGAAAAEGRYLLFMNDDVEPLTEGWIESMLQYAQLPEVGAVSPKLLWADDTIQYGGLVFGVRNLVGTAFHGWPRADSGYHSMAVAVRNVSCVNGACMLIRAEAFHDVGGWDAENTPISHSDFDLSFRILERGLRLVYQPFAELRHLGHQSRKNAEVDERAPVGRADSGADVYLLHRWGSRLREDPFYPSGMRELLHEDNSAYEVFGKDGMHLSRQWWDLPRVLLVGHEFSSTGAPVMLLEIARALREAGMVVVCTSPVGGDLVDDCVRLGIPVVIDEEILRDPARAARFMQTFDVIGANTVVGWGVVNQAAELGVPCVWFVQEPQFGLPTIREGGSAARAAFACADRVVFPSHATERLYGEFGDARRYQTIHYGIEDVARCAPDDAPFERVDGDVHVTHAGTVQRRKGADVLIEAVRRLPPDLRARLHTHFLGPQPFPDYTAELERLADGLEHGEFVGEVDRTTGLGYIRHSDLFVCTSRDESGPVVVIEAMALGRPVISTPVGLVGEVLRDGVDGRLVPIDDVDALAEALERLIGDADLRHGLGAEARKTYERYLDRDRYAADVVELFEQVLAGRRSPGRPQAASVGRSR